MVLEQSELGDMVDRMSWERDNMLLRYNKNYNNKEAMGVSTLTLMRKRQDQWLGHIMRDINLGGLTFLINVFIVEGDSSPQQEVFKNILLAPKFETFIDGFGFLASQATDLQTNPVVQALTALKFHFENLAEVSNVNLATELGDILTLPPSSSMHDIIHLLDKLVDPIAKTYFTVEEFMNLSLIHISEPTRPRLI
eukprot:2404863-Rhodomonas_salina.1